MASQMYEKLHTSNRDSDDVSHESTESLLPQDLPARRRKHTLSIIIYIITIVLSVLLGALGVKVFDKPSLSKNDLPMHYAPSPITHDVKIQYHWQDFNGSFMQENVYRKAGSPEVDKAWKALGVDYRAIIVPEDLAKEAGISRDQVKVRAKYGGGYPANVEGLHQLHCLNLVRQALYYNIDYYRAKGKGAFENKEPIVQRHVSHCLDIIRQQLMCTIDTGVLGQVWWQAADAPFPSAFVDFNTRHVCKNFDAVREWAEKRQLPLVDDLPDDWLEPPAKGAKILNHVP